jgi:hypothetical protein
VNGAVADRVRDAADDYPQEDRFYDQLERSAERVYRREPGGGYEGPWVAVYRLR